MRFPEFDRAAHRAFREIPPEYREGVDGLTVREEALPHPTLPDIYTLGECRTEAYPSEWGGPDTTRSMVVLYWGSFRNLARLDPDFDWEGEIWETLTHEVRHHLEWLAERDELGGVDYALDETFKRGRGMEFDPWYFQHGEAIVPGRPLEGVPEQTVYRVEEDFYLEQAWTPHEFGRRERIPFAWHGTRYTIPRPDEMGDVHYVWIHQVEAGPGGLELVLVRRRSAWESLKAVFRGHHPVVLESEALAEPSLDTGSADDET